MQRRQTDIPRQWLIVDARSGADPGATIRRIPDGSGILVLCRDLARGERERLLRRIRRLARERHLLVVDGGGRDAARVHDARELGLARLSGTRLLFMSPMFPTRSHPDWPPMPRMRAAALARLAHGPVLALGGMDSRRFARVKALGFYGWAGIDAWEKVRRRAPSRK